MAPIEHLGNHRRWRALSRLRVLLLLVYPAVAYLLMPGLWTRYARRHPSLDAIPHITYTGSHIPGDPLNVALIGTETDLKKIMLAAEWYPADPLTLRSCLKIASATMLKRPYDDAHVSNPYLFGRKEDLAFERPVSDNPRQRHHVRFGQGTAEHASVRAKDVQELANPPG
jgi:hypothetical protein